ncbi:cytochrome P450 [Actinosynnema pretiosum subsp. pretiosum]|uniref:Nocardicin C N-oxygenase n=3 Tax=Actinomycetes TaxID=1760 RepID=NOCL_NOCUT|nr:cytochrome P450 [Actinosynnema mirum]Q5J1R4.1 RecName: Full=Nocardicin C N-oxygenase [Nocardia uniformis subsp. tsuyamanensis]AXX31974.1 putative cytochrome P450 hydroxylase [Actinosynnema pretiosum subsp. pretiosum]AAT09797.1 NocL [Nocardia uniformis subsp. tsuyamanensis]ACU38429.1 cytochrome P450 [Actinosynnema mirum DSM 43827]QUF04048.1 cytochrome P450 [Actinosynnema pretiosum subsp. pretiosum]
MTRTDTRSYPFGDPVALDLHPGYAPLRAEQPALRVRLPYGEDCWLVTRHEDVKAVLSDSRFSRARAAGREETPRVTPEAAPAGSMLSMDPPEHSRLRKLIARAFTSRRVREFRPRTQEIVDGLLDQVEQAGAPADLVAGLALPLPVSVISQMLGVPTEDHYRFRDFSATVLSTTAHTREEIVAARAALEEYLGELADQRRREPGEDLMSALVAAHDDDRLTDRELTQTGITLLVGGHESTASQFACSVYLLLERPERWALLRDNPELVPTAVEELLRFIPLGSGGAFARIATEDVEVGGVLVRAGEAVVASTNSANRDDRVFTDPDVLDLAREHNPHLAFGGGVHVCLGAQLARGELQVALTSLLTRFPGLRLAVPPEQVPWRQGSLLRSPVELPVTW